MCIVNSSNRGWSLQRKCIDGRHCSHEQRGPAACKVQRGRKRDRSEAAHQTQPGTPSYRCIASVGGADLSKQPLAVAKVEAHHVSGGEARRPRQEVGGKSHFHIKCLILSISAALLLCMHRQGPSWPPGRAIERDPEPKSLSFVIRLQRYFFCSDGIPPAPESSCPMLCWSS
jgi:hypothetical protein